jgi:hypothetical protein
MMDVGASTVHQTVILPLILEQLTDRCSPFRIAVLNCLGATEYHHLARFITGVGATKGIGVARAPF